MGVDKTYTVKFFDFIKEDVIKEIQINDINELPRNGNSVSFGEDIKTVKGIQHIYELDKLKEIIVIVL